MLQHLPLNAGLGIDIWHGAGALACSSKRFRSLHPSGRATNCDRRPSTPDRRIGYHVESKETWRTLLVAVVAAEIDTFPGRKKPPDEWRELAWRSDVQYPTPPSPGRHRGQWRFGFNNARPVPVDWPDANPSDQ